MKKKSLSFTFSIGLLLGAIGLAGCAGTATTTSTGEYIDDTAITARVKTALVTDDIVPALAVQVETFRGNVQLSGFVDTAEQKSRAEQVARGVGGVQEVVNNITLKPAQGQTAQPATQPQSAPNTGTSTTR